MFASCTNSCVKPFVNCCLHLFTVVYCKIFTRQFWRFYSFTERTNRKAQATTNNEKCQWYDTIWHSHYCWVHVCFKNCYDKYIVNSRLPLFVNNPSKPILFLVPWWPHKKAVNSPSPLTTGLTTNNFSLETLPTDDMPLKQFKASGL